MVLTYNSPRRSRHPQALGNQTRLPDSLLILDNAGTPPAATVTKEWSRPSELDVRVIREPENSGPAGGWACALEEFLRSPFDLAWILDDDIVAPPQSLASLLAEYQEMGVSGALIPSVRTPSGPSLISPVGLESSWRARWLKRWASESGLLLVGRRFRVPDAAYPCRGVSHAHHVGSRAGPPTGAASGESALEVLLRSKEQCYLHLYIKHGRGRWPRKLAGLTLRAIVREDEGRALRLKMIGRASWTGSAVASGDAWSP